MPLVLLSEVICKAAVSVVTGVVAVPDIRVRVVLVVIGPAVTLAIMKFVLLVPVVRFIQTDIVYGILEYVIPPL
jgi:hypothetical protein